MKSFFKSASFVLLLISLFFITFKTSAQWSETPEKIPSENLTPPVFQVEKGSFSEIALYGKSPTLPNGSTKALYGLKAKKPHGPGGTIYLLRANEGDVIIQMEDLDGDGLADKVSENICGGTPKVSSPLIGVGTSASIEMPLNPSQVDLIWEHSIDRGKKALRDLEEDIVLNNVKFVTAKVIGILKEVEFTVSNSTKTITMLVDKKGGKIEIMSIDIKDPNTARVQCLAGKNLPQECHDVAEGLYKIWQP